MLPAFGGACLTGVVPGLLSHLYGHTPRGFFPPDDSGFVSGLFPAIEWSRNRSSHFGLDTEFE